jgi:hypothetical protein
MGARRLEAERDRDPVTLATQALSATADDGVNEAGFKATLRRPLRKADPLLEKRAPNFRWRQQGEVAPRRLLGRRSRGGAGGCLRGHGVIRQGCGAAKLARPLLGAQCKRRPDFRETFVVKQPSGHDVCEVLGTASIRLRAAAQLFKRTLLRAAHEPAAVQLAAVTRAISDGGVADGEWVSEGTWVNWCRGKGIAQRDALARLDRVVSLALRGRARDCAPMWWPDAFLQSLVRGGALRSVASSRTAGRFGLVAGLMDYAAPSAWHLHFDALEASAIHADCRGVSWSLVKSAVAMTVLSALNELWGRRGGLIYPHLSAVSEPKCDDATAQTVALAGGMRSILRRTRAIDLSRAAVPDWHLVRSGSDAAAEHACITMVSLVADRQFLRGEHAFTWAFDLATATLATKALLWSERAYSFRTSPPSDTLVVWLGLEQLMFAESEGDIDHRRLNAALKVAGVPWTKHARQLLFEAREHYWMEMRSVGLSIVDIAPLASRCEVAHPIRAVG